MHLNKIALAIALALPTLPAFADGQGAITSDSAVNFSASAGALDSSQRQTAYTQAAQTTALVATQDAQRAQQAYSVWQNDLAQASYYSNLQQQASADASSATDPTTAQADAQQAQAYAQQAQYWTGKAQQDDDAYQAWLAASSGAQAESGQQTANAAAQGALNAQQQAQQQSSYNTLFTSDVPQAQSDTAQQAIAGNPESQASLDTIAQQTGVAQGQMQPAVSAQSADTGYLAAAAAGQAAMSGLAMANQQANIQAVQAAQNAQSCGTPGCSAAWWAVNQAAQQTANGLYASQIAAAPALASTYITAGTQAAQSSFDSVQSQIGQLTGVSQQITATLPTAVSPALFTVTNDTSYETIGQSQNDQQVTDATTNTTATFNAVQDTYNGLQAQTQADAAQTVAQQDTAAAQAATSASAQQAWQGAAAIAANAGAPYQALADQYRANLSNDTVQQNTSAAAVQADTNGQAEAMNAAANQSAVNSFNATLSSINQAVAAPAP